MWCCNVCRACRIQNVTRRRLCLRVPFGTGGHYGMESRWCRVAAVGGCLAFHCHESGAGVAVSPVPQLSQLIAEHPTMSKNFKGFAVGNPSFNFKVDGSHYWEFMYTHALFGSQVCVRCRVCCALCFCFLFCLSDVRAVALSGVFQCTESVRGHNHREQGPSMCPGGRRAARELGGHHAV